ncbi:ras-domain-containing protein, partial [Wilcoxina mikolae CBS 423.85]
HFDENMYQPWYETMRKHIVIDGTPCGVELLYDAWDFREDIRVCETYTRRTAGFRLMYSITFRETFAKIVGYHEWIKKYMKETGRIRPVISVGSKCDLHQQREVDIGEGLALAKEIGCEFLEASAKTGKNVGHAVNTVVRALLAERK